MTMKMKLGLKKIKTQMRTIMLDKEMTMKMTTDSNYDYREISF